MTTDDRHFEDFVCPACAPMLRHLAQDRRALERQLDEARRECARLFSADSQLAEASVWLREAVEHIRCGRGFPGGCGGRNIRLCHECETRAQIRAFLAR